MVTLLCYLLSDRNADSQEEPKTKQFPWERERENFVASGKEYFVTLVNNGRKGNDGKGPETTKWMHSNVEKDEKGEREFFGWRE